MQVRTALLGCRWSDAASWVPLAEMMDSVRGEQRGLDEFREAVRQPCRKYEVKTRRKHPCGTMLLAETRPRTLL